MIKTLSILTLSIIACGLLAFSVQQYIQKKVADQSSVLPMPYQQRAAEYRALCLQAYRMARIQAQQEWDKAMPEQRKHLAVVTDLDETALDNTPGEAYAYVHDPPSGASMQRWQSAAAYS